MVNRCKTSHTNQGVNIVALLIASVKAITSAKNRTSILLSEKCRI